MSSGAGYIDISHTLSEDFAPWPGDTAFSRVVTASIAEGDSVNLTTMTLSGHTGTHIDAPYHYHMDGLGLEALDPGLFIGDCALLDVENLEDATGKIGVLPLARALEYRFLSTNTLPKRLLLRTGYKPGSPFVQSFGYPSPTSIAMLASRGVRLIGTDAPSMDAIDSKRLPTHRACARHGVIIMELLRLEQVSEGYYFLIAPPHKVADADGFPVRALLFDCDYSSIPRRDCTPSAK